MKDWKVIISSKSGLGKAAKIWGKVSEVLRKKGISFSASFTEYQKHAIQLAQEAIREGYRKILTVGGDGAMHEVINGVMTQSDVPTGEITLAIIPVGSGNDWARLHRIPKNVDDAVDLLNNGKIIHQDIVRVDSIKQGEPSTSYMMNIGGLGIDAMVCNLFEDAKKRGKKGDVQYFKCLIEAFIWYACCDFRINVDGEPFFEGPAFSVAIGNGKYCGGGMLQTPDAVCDDGLMDITVTRKISRAKFMASVKKLYDGTITKLKEVSTTRGKVFEIFANPASHMEVDGEYVGVTPARLSIIPAAVNVISNIEDNVLE